MGNKRRGEIGDLAIAESTLQGTPAAEGRESEEISIAVISHSLDQCPPYGCTKLRFRMSA